MGNGGDSGRWADGAFENGKKGKAAWEPLFLFRRDQHSWRLCLMFGAPLRTGLHFLQRQTGCFNFMLRLFFRGRYFRGGGIWLCFIKHEIRQRKGLQQDLEQDLQQNLQQEYKKATLYSDVLIKIASEPLSRKEISEALGQKKVSGQLNKIISRLMEDQLIVLTIPNNKNHPNQRFKITEQGVIFLGKLKGE